MRPLLALTLAAVALMVLAPAAQAGPWKRCGGTSGAFPVGGFKPIRAEVRGIKAHNVGCRRAKRFAHKLFFGQECVRCDAEDSYEPGERVRFKGFACSVSLNRRFDQVFHCRRGAKRINFRTYVHI